MGLIRDTRFVGGSQVMGLILDTWFVGGDQVMGLIRDTEYVYSAFANSNNLRDFGRCMRSTECHSSLTCMYLLKIVECTHLHSITS